MRGERESPWKIPPRISKVTERDSAPEPRVRHVLPERHSSPDEASDNLVKTIQLHHSQYPIVRNAVKGFAKVYPGGI